MGPRAVQRCLLALLVALWALALPARAAATAPPADVVSSAELEVFTRPGCSHCARARAWLAELRQRHPEWVILERDVAADPRARDWLLARAATLGQVAAVPAFRLGDRLIIGFDAPSTTGAEIEAAVAGTLDEATRSAPRRVRIPWFGEISVEDLGLPAFTLALGLVDGFNPCAMWVLLFLLSLLVNLHSRRKMALVGGTFVVVSGLAYLIFMAAWLSVFRIVGVTRWLQLGLGGIALAVGAIHLKDSVHPSRGPSLSIPDSAKPGIYARVRTIVYAENLRGALVATVTLAVVVNLIELMCTAGLPAIYTQVLVAQHLPPWQHYGYLVLYIAAYMADDALMLTIAVATLSRRKLQQRAGRALQLVSGGVMILLGLALLLRPELLAFR